MANQKRAIQLICMIFCDLIIAGALLCIFALFHHVIRKPGDTGNVLQIGKPTAQPTETPAPNEDKSSVPVQTDTSYISENISITIKTIQSGSGSTALTYYLADIYVKDIECIRTAFARGTYGQNYAQSVLEQDFKNNAILAISGDSYGLSDSGVVIRNGTLYRYKENSSDICVLYYDGTMATLSPGEYSKESLIEDGAYQAWTFGPKLLDENGKALIKFNTSSYLLQKHPRCAIGYYEPGHYVFLLANGRQADSQGLTMKQMAALFEELGCTAAYNLDGGKSTVMTFNDRIANDPYDEPRNVSDIIYIGET